MNVLAIDKTALLLNNRKRYKLLCQDPAINLTLLTTKEWVENSQPVKFEADAEDTPQLKNFKIVIGKVWMHGHAMLAGYYSGLIKAFVTSKPDVIFMLEESFSIFALQAIFLAKIFCPTAKIVFYNWHILSYRNFPHKLGYLYRFMGTALAGMSDVGLSHLPKSKQALDDARTGVKSVVMFQGLNSKIFAANPLSKKEARNQLGLNTDIIYFLYVGRLLKAKGIDDAVKVITQLRDELKLDLQFVIVGNGEYRQELEKLTKELNAEHLVHFYGSIPIEQVPVFMRAADCLLLPSKKVIEEQFGRVIAEAMFSKTFVIGSTSGQIPNAICNDGFVFQADNLQDFKRVIKKFLTEKELVNNIIEAAYTNSLEKYSVESFVMKVRELLYELYNH